MDVVNCIKYIHFMVSDPPPFYGGGGGGVSFKRAPEKIFYFRVDPKFKWGGVALKTLCIPKILILFMIICMMDKLGLVL